MFCLFFFGHKACGILTVQSRIEHTLPPLEGKVLTIRLPEKSLNILFVKHLQCKLDFMLITGDVEIKYMFNLLGTQA